MYNNCYEPKLLHWDLVKLQSPLSDHRWVNTFIKRLDNDLASGVRPCLQGSLQTAFKWTPTHAPISLFSFYVILTRSDILHSLFCQVIMKASGFHRKTVFSFNNTIFQKSQHLMKTKVNIIITLEYRIEQQHVVVDALLFHTLRLTRIYSIKVCVH